MHLASKHFFLALLVAGCAAAPLPRGTDQPKAPAATAIGAVAISDPIALPEAAMGGATLVFQIRWPALRTQAIPSVARSIEIIVNRGDQTLRALTVTRDAGTVGNVTAKIERLPAGPVTVIVNAKDVGGAIVASGTKDVTLLVNKQVALGLTLALSNPPTISDISPKAGAQGTLVNITGTNLPLDTEIYSLNFGGTAAPAVQSFGRNSLAVSTPAGATTSPLILTVDGMQFASSALFTTVGSISLTAASAATMASGDVRVFTSFPYDTSVDLNKVGGAPLSFELTNPVGVNPPTGGAGLVPGGAQSGNLGLLMPGSFTTGVTGEATFSFTAQATGSAWINVKCGNTLKATLSVTVR